MAQPQAPDIPGPLAAALAAGDQLGPVARDLLLYKALFQGRWFEGLASGLDDGRIAHTLLAMSRETVTEVTRAIDALAAWNRIRADLDDVATALRTRVLNDLLHLKESTSEAFLLVGLRAPTDELRRAFVRLADVERKHADSIRELLGPERVVHRAYEHSFSNASISLGAHGARPIGGSLSANIVHVTEQLRRDGQEPLGLILSAAALRHARDEALLGPEDGKMLGLDVEVDHGWRGECFAVRTRERASLADLLASRSTLHENDQAGAI